MDWRGVGSNPAGDIYFHFEFFAPSPFRTGQRSRCKWNQACPFTWSHSCFRPQIWFIIQGLVYKYLQYSFKDNVIDSCCACYILCRWIVILCCLHIMMSCTSSILCRWIAILCCHRVMMSCACYILWHWVVRLCCIHIMMSCACSILCRWVVILCCHHVMMSCACSILCRWIVRLCCLYSMMSCAFSIPCRWVVVLCCQNNIIILCCHHSMTSCASVILCCWVTMLCWMFGTDLTFGTNELPVDKVIFPSQAISLFCYIGHL